MASIITKVCDVCDPEQAAKAETLKVSVDRATWEIDLCAQHREEISATLGEMFAAGRRARGTRGRPRANAPVIHPVETWDGKKNWTCPHSECGHVLQTQEAMRKHLRRSHGDWTTSVSTKVRTTAA